MQTLVLHMGANMDTFSTLPIDPFDIVHQNAGLSVEGVIEEDEEEE